MVSSQITQGEPLKTKIVFRNNAKTQIALNEEIYTWREAMLDFDLSTPSGHKSEKSYLPARRPVPHKDDFKILGPGETVGWEIEVTFWYEIREPGKYSMTAVYSNTNDGAAFGLKAYVGKVRSNAVSFEVIKKND